MPDLSFFIFIGIILIILGFLSLAIGMMGYAMGNETPGKKSISNTEPETEVKGGGVILIGPIPIVFGSDKRYAIIAILLTIALMILGIIFLYYSI